MSFLDDLRWRGLVHQTTDDAGLAAWLEAKPRVVYAGFDPTADSLHVGQPAAADAAAAVSAGRAQADRRRRRGDRHDRRPQRQEPGTEPALEGSARRQRRRHARADAAASSTSSGRNAGRAGEQLRLDRAVELPRVPARRRQEFSRQRDARQGLGEGPARTATDSGHELHRVQLHAAAGVRLRASLRQVSAASCKSAAATNGATSRPASTSPGGCAACSSTA